MSTPNLEITATANVAPAVRGLETLDKSLQKVAEDGQRLRQGGGDIASAFSKIPPATGPAINAVDKLSTSLNKLPNSSGQATQALINLGRVAQDAPFGIIGIANNINPLLESFQRLQASTGSTKAALSSLAGSLLGGGGLGLAVSVVTGLMSYFALQGLSKSTEEAEKNNKVITRLKDSYQIFTEEVSRLAEAAAKEAVQISVLFGALGDTNIKLDKRKEIIEQLNKLSPAYLGNLDKEKASYEQISTAITSYIDDLGKTAFIKSFLPEFEGIFKKLIETQVELRKLNLAQNGVFGLSEQDYAAERKRLETQIRLLIQDVSSAKKFLEREAGGALKLSEILFGKQIVVPEVKVKVKKVKVEREKHDDVKLFFPEVETKRTIGLEVPKLNLNFKSVEIDPEAQQRMLNAINSFLLSAKISDAINATLDTILNDTISTIASSVGDILAGNAGALPSLFDNLIKGIGQQVTELGKYLVKVGLEMLAAKKAIEVLGLTPQGAIIAGIGLQILGSLLKAAATKKTNQTGFASGGTVGQSGVYNVGERGQERVFLPAGSRVQPNNEVNAYGGGQVQERLVATISATDLVILLQRGEAIMGRNN